MMKGLQYKKQCKKEDKFKYYLLRGNLHSLQQMLGHAKSDYKKAIDHAQDPESSLPARFLYAGLCEVHAHENELADIPPVEAGDSDAEAMQHMAVIRDVMIPVEN